MYDLDPSSQAMLRQTVLCVGDLMLDEFAYGEVLRISKAPAPVIAAGRAEVLDALEAIDLRLTGDRA
jgi:D-beta-D-heptose 7-phosphate kinase/D-beta-D-heptose 1-phosphate adenosyltransferase